MRVRIRTRLTLIFGLLVLIVLGATGAFLYLRLGANLTDAIDAGLRSRADTIAASLNGKGTSLRNPAALLDSDAAFAQILSRRGAVLDSSQSLSNLPLVASRTLRGVSMPRYLEASVPDPRGEPIEARLLALPTARGQVVVVGANLEQRRAALARLTELMWIGGPIVLVVVTAIGWLLAGAALRPVESMRRQAEGLSAGESEQRLSVASTGDEIERLGTTLNAMLERLQGALERERRIVDDAGHELRTPLAILRTELELALSQSRSKEELQAALRSASEESDRLNRLAEDLLILARSKEGKLPVRKETIDLGLLLRNVSAAFDGRAAAACISLNTDVAGCVAKLDPIRIRQALDNLVDNALRHTPRGGAVSVTARHDGDGTIILVQDSGEGFPEAFLPRSFEPFARSTGGRSRGDGGAGLGLAIVKAIAESHGGSVSARNAEAGGAVVSLELPG